MTKLEAASRQFEKALGRFKEVLGVPKTDIVRDSAIQRFEFCFDLAWKTIKAFLEDHHKVQCASPRSCLKEAYRQGLIPYDDFWLRMADMRNQAAHTYNEELAEEIYAALPQTLKRLEMLLLSIKQNVD